MVAEARKRCLLADGSDVERPANLCDRGHDLLGADPIPHPQSGEPEDLGERPQDEHAPAGLRILGDPVRVVGVVDVLEVRLIEDGQDVRRNSREVRVELGARVRRARRVVGRRDEDELGPRRDGCEDRLEVEPSALKRHPNRRPADLERIEDVARERGPARDGLVTGPECREREVADDRVGTGAHCDLLETDPVPLRECLPEPIGAAVRVAVELERRPLDRLQRRREGAVGPFVGGQLDDPLET